ncbi:cell division protein PerM [Aeromicrobium sp. CF3.5]|uniref:cell division protein PerM n=1 Tax=Aeromicrobium sp. CF3.5 TaxID=3373078 RepID=UPI003EE5E1FF
MSEPSTTPYLRAAVLAGPLAAAVSVLVSAAVVLVARGSDGAAPVAIARTAGQVWLASIGSGLTADGISISVIPIGATLIAIAVTASVVAWTLPEPVDELPAFTISAAGFHAVFAAIVAALASAGGVEVSPVRAAAAGFVVGGLGAAIGAVRRHGGGDALWFTISADVRRAVRAGVVGAAVVPAVGLVIVVALLLRHLDRAGDLWALLDPGFGGAVVVAVGCLLAIPTLVLWTSAALIGPGFALGTDTSVDLTGSQLGAVPGFPVLAALPDPGQFAGWTFLLGLVPLLAGAVAGWRTDPGDREGLMARVLAGAAAGAVGGFMLGVLVGASGGAIGPGRMEQTGPSALTPLLVVLPVMAVGGAIGAVLAHYRGEGVLQLPASGASSSGRPRVWERIKSAGPDRRDDQS